MGFWTIFCYGLLDHSTNKLHSQNPPFVVLVKNRAYKHRAIAKAMTTLRRFCCNDLLRFTSVNLDHLTETVFFSISIPLLLISMWGFLVFQFPLNSVLMQSSSPFFSFAVQYVLLYDLLGKMAWLLPCRGGPWEPHNGLQWVSLPSIALSLCLSEWFGTLLLSCGCGNWLLNG